MSDFILPFDVWPQQIVQASVPANRNALRSEILGSRVISDSLTVQPSIPTDGDVYIIPSGATGSAWSAYDVDDLAIFREGTWYAFAPVPGVRLVVGSIEKIYEGSSGWQVFSAGGGGSAAWGAITGTLADQADLQDALDEKLESVQAGAGISIDNTDPLNPVISATGGGGSVDWGDIGGTLADQADLQDALDEKLESVQAGAGISIDNTDPLNPVISATGGGGSVDWGDIGGTLSDQTDLKNALDSIDAKAKPGQIGVTFDAGSGDLEPGSFGDFIVPWDATITGWTILCSGAANAQVDVWVDSLVNFPPDITDSITGGNAPTISGQAAEQETNLTGWETVLVAGTVVRFVLSSVSSVSRLTLILNVEKS